MGKGNERATGRGTSRRSARQCRILKTHVKEAALRVKAAGDDVTCHSVYDELIRHHKDEGYSTLAVQRILERAFWAKQTDRCPESGSHLTVFDVLE
jgi:hypothetical protein